MGLRLLLHCSATWILKATPNLQGGSDGKVQAGVWEAAGSAGGQCAALTAGNTGHRASRDAVRGAERGGDGAVWPVEGTPVGAVPGAGARDSEPRYLQ